MHNKHMSMLSITVAFLTLVIAFSAHATDVEIGGIGFNVKLGFAGHFRPNTWAPIQVQISNEGVPFDARVEVILSLGNSYLSQPARVVYRRPVSLPSGTKKQLLFTLPITNINQPLDIRLVESNGNILQSVRIPLRDASVTADIVLVLDTSGERWTWLQEVTRQSTTFQSRSRVYVAHAQSAAELPTEWVAYESVRTVILTDSFPITSLSQEQLQALTKWVETGGHLLIVGGPALNAAVAPELAGLLPVTLTGGSRAATLQRITLDTAPLPTPLRTVIWNAKSSEGKIDQYVDGVPFIAHRWAGSGRVTYLGFDLAARALRNWSSLDSFSRELVFPPRMVRRSTGSLEGSLLPLLSAEKIPYPRHIWLICFALIYIALVNGSLSLVSAKRAGWLLLVVSVAIGCAYVQVVVKSQAAKAMRAYSEIRISQVAPQTGIAHSVAMAQMVNMRGGDWKINQDTGVYLAPASALLRDLDTVLVLEQNETNALLGPIQARQALAVTSQSLEELPLYTSLQRRGDSMVVTLENKSPWMMRHAFFVDKQRYVSLGNVAPGAKEEVSFPSDRFVVATDTLSPDWIAANVATVARENAHNNDRRQFQALEEIVSHALSPSRDTDQLPWGSPLLVAIIETPVQPPLAESYTGLGYHFVVVPLSSLLDTSN